MNRVALLFGFSLVLISSARAQLTPAEAIKKFTVAEGLQVELFAAEPMLINPTSIDVDHKGRVWVCEAVNYRVSRSGKPLYRPEGDRIVVLEDTDGDGKADKSHVFYQAKDLIAPLGIAVAPYPDGKGQKIFVCHHSDIVVFEDKDGDLKADGPPTKLLGGFGGFDTDHGLHGINIGPDGKLYFTVGDAGVKGVQSSDGKGPKWTSNQTDCRAGTVWRCDLDGKNLELIAHNFRNHYECCVNSFGEIWTSDNDDDGTQQTRLCYVMPGGNYGYHPRGPGQSHWHEEQPGVVHKVLRTGFGSPSGICFYEGTLLPKKYHGQLLHCDAGPREFRCFHLTPKGAGYEAEKEVLVTSSDNWFRLSDCCVAPDGSVMLADWYDPGVGGNGMGDWKRGRIYRVTPKGHKGYKVPAVKTDSARNVIQALSSPCTACRTIAFHAIKTQFGPNDAGDLMIQAQDTFYNTYCGYVTYLRLMWTRSHYKNQFASHNTKKEIFDSENVAEYEWFGRAWGIRRFTSDIGGLEKVNPEQQDVLFKYVTDPEYGQSIRRELLLSLSKTALPTTLELFYPLAKQYDGHDHFYRAALNIACGTDPARRDAILADFDKHFPDWNDKVADLVWELRPKSVMPRLVKLLGDAKLTGAQKARIVDILAASDDASAGQSLLALLGKDSPAEVRDRALDNLRLFLPTKWKDLANARELAQAIDNLLADAATRAVGLRLIAAAGSVDALKKVSDIALGENDPPTRREAVRTLGNLLAPPAVETLEKIVATDPLLVVDAIDALGLHVSANPKKENNTAALALTVLQNALLRAKSPPGTKQAALAALAGSFAGAKWLLDAHESKELPKELIADAGKLLRNSPYQALRNRALALFPTPGKLDPAKLPTLTELAKRIGDVERGKEIWIASFKGETQCARCHTVHGRGGQIGPDLSLIGAKASLENLFESILLPSKAIADQYLQWKIETTNGQSILGLLVEETPSAVTIRDANGKDTKIAKADIDSRTKSPTSIMPEDVVKVLSEDDLIDLVAFLFTLKNDGNGAKSK